MGVTRLAINRPIAILMLVAAFVVLGLFSYTKLPAELNPKVDFGVVTVVTTYPGTSPTEMETLVTKPIEDSISGVSGLKQISSTSQQGISIVRCEFFIGSDIDTAAADLRQKVDAARQLLPRDADSPIISKQDTSAQPVMYITMSGGQSSRQLRVLADNIVKQRLEQAPDVAAVSVTGGDQREILVSVHSSQLAAYGITIGQLATAIQNANANISAGYIQSGSQYVSLRFIGEFADVNEIKGLRLTFGGSNSTPPGSTGTSSGTNPQRVVNLSDIADVSDSTAERTDSSTIDGRDSVTLAISKTSDGNTLNAVAGVKTQLELVKKSLPHNIVFTYAVDTSKNVKDNLKDVVVSLFLGALFAVTIVFLFLHNLRATIIVAVAIPTCIISTFLPISALGFSLNTMTLLGLSLAIGILIDDSIVVLENIVRHLRLGESPKDAAIIGRSEIGLAAVTLTAVDLVVFVPIAFMGGVIGEFFRSFGAAISIAILFSLFVSFTLTPMLAARWFKTGESLESDGEGKKGFFALLDRGYGRLERRYRKVLDACLRHPWIVVTVGNVLLVLALSLIFPKLGFRFAPGQDQNQVAVHIESPAGSSLSYTKLISDEVERRIRADHALNNDVKYLLTQVGSSRTGGTAGLTGTQYATINVTLFDKAAPLDKIAALFHPRNPNAEPLRQVTDSNVAAQIRALVKNIPGARIQAAEVNGFGGGGAPLTINVVGTDFGQILSASNTIKNLVSKYPGVYNTDISFKASQPEVQIRLDRVRAAQYGLTLQQIAQSVSQSFLGDITAKYRDPADNEQYNIRVQLANKDRNNIFDIGNTPVAYQNGQAVLLSSVANLQMGAGPTQIDRLNRQRQVSVTGYLLPGTEIGNVNQKLDPILKKMLKQGNLGNISYTWGGEAQSLGDEGPYLVQALLLGIILAYMLMAALFNSLLYPLTVMLTLPQALVGALTALLIAGQPFSLIAAIGVIMLNGLAAKNAILLVDYTNTLRKRGLGRREALMEAAPIRLRPILMTSMAIIGATLPTALALGRGAGFRQSLGIVVVGGVIVSTVLTLIVIPCVYTLFDNFGEFTGRVRTNIFGAGAPSMLPDGPIHIEKDAQNRYSENGNSHYPTVKTDVGNSGSSTAPGEQPKHQ